MDFHRILPIPFGTLITCEYLMAESCEIGEENGQGAETCVICWSIDFAVFLSPDGSLKGAWNGIFRSILCPISSDELAKVVLSNI